MATKTGASGVVKLQVSGTTVAVVGEVRSFTFEGSADTIEDSVMGDISRTYKAGLKTNTVSIECYWDEADAQQLVLDERASLDFEIYPTGTGTGETYFSGAGIVTSKSITGSFDGMVEASFSLQVSGDVTEAQA
jgi:predicted secreted protein|tara:strand:- start:8937 stop:9338 length:402 start_codon:yes stop_codon:yes gene_type:complete